MMRQRWTAYIYERFPPLIYGSLSLGIALSGGRLNHPPVDFLPTLLAFIGIWVFLFALRVGNDLNDLAKDRIAHPERPFPAGKISLHEGRQILIVLLLFLFAYSELLWICLEGTAALSFLLLAAWAWLYSKEFYARKWLQKMPATTTVVLSLYMILLALFSVSAGQPLRIFSDNAWAYAAALYGAALTFSLARTLSPHLHPITGAFIHFYGYRNTFYLMTAGIVISAAGATVLQMGGLLWPMEFIVLGTLFVPFYQPEQYRIPEMAASVSLIVHAWSGIF